MPRQAPERHRPFVRFVIHPALGDALEQLPGLGHFLVEFRQKYFVDRHVSSKSQCVWSEDSTASRLVPSEGVRLRTQNQSTLRRNNGCPISLSRAERVCGGG